MAEVRLSALAISDLAEIDEYGAEHFGPAIADDYARGFRHTWDLLRSHPFAGSPRPELGRGVRSLRHERHRIYYVVKGDVVVVGRIYHHARDVRRSHLQ